MRPARFTAFGALGLALLGILYLSLWPVPIDPVAWDAPRDDGLNGAFAANEALRAAQLIDLGGHHGPEDVAAGPDGRIYAAVASGDILRMAADGSAQEVFAHTGGRPLGIEFDTGGMLYVANATLGIQRVDPGGRVELLTDSIDGQPFGYPDDLAVAANGRIYLSDASSKFTARDWGGSYSASLLDIMEHGGHGRIIEFDPERGRSRVIAEGLNFANGVAISEDQQYLLVAETGHYRILRLWLDGARAGEREVVIGNLPGFPDNINNGNDGRFWIGLVAPRNALLDGLSGYPALRRSVQRLPAWVRPAAVPSSHLIAIDGTGTVIANLQDSSARMPAMTGAIESGEAIFVSSLMAGHIARLDWPQ